jgi:hypothetical protein
MAVATAFPMPKVEIPAIYLFFDKSVEFISKSANLKEGATQLYKEYN